MFVAQDPVKLFGSFGDLFGGAIGIFDDVERSVAFCHQFGYFFI